MSTQITTTSNTGNFNHHYNSLSPSTLTSTLIPNTSLKGSNGINLKLVSAVGGYILEVHHDTQDSVGYYNPKKYILREKNIGKQIEKILAIELLKR